MSSKLLSLVIAASLTFGAAAFAATETSGTIKAIDTTALTITLDDGTVYYLPAGFKLDAYKPGETVKITWDMQADKHEASAVTAE